MDKEVREALRGRYPHLHPLIFLRSAEKAHSNGELFDILEGFPKEYPVIWDDEKRVWCHTSDLLQNHSVRGD